VSLSPILIKALWKQQKNLLSNSPEGVYYIFNEEDTLDIQADIEGPKDTPYENGIFRVKILISSEFPNMPPKGKIKNKNKNFLLFLIIKIIIFFYSLLNKD
jgi:ubiquitin-conjugating enzyme E2 S